MSELTTPNPGLRYYYPLSADKEYGVTEVDICVYGGTPAGVAAAVQGARLGKSVVLAVFRRHVGGMTSAGLTAVDLGRVESIGGIARQYLERMGSWSDFRPTAAEALFRRFLEEAQIPVLYEHRLSSATKLGTRIIELGFENGHRIRAKVFIDATYDADLVARAGCDFQVGREDNQRYDETLNGFQIARTHQFQYPVDPYIRPGEPASGLLPGISYDPPRRGGTGDRAVQAYNFRMWAIAGEQSIPFPKPDCYDRREYALLERYLTTRPNFPWDLNYKYGPVKLNAGDCNNAGPVSTDFVGGSYEWPNASYVDREKIFQAHVRYQQGLMWFLANDDAVPPGLRQRVQSFGLPPNEFCETGGWPHELYVRESRRMIGDYVMTEHHCLGRAIAPDSVGLASYQMDSHHTSRVVMNGRVAAEGCIEVAVPQPYPVSYRALTPKSSQCSNLLVPVCVSSSHVAYGSIRMEPVFMILGQSAGTAAALAIQSDVAVQQVSYPQLKSQLLADKQCLSVVG